MPVPALQESAPRASEPTQPAERLCSAFTERRPCPRETSALALALLSTLLESPPPQEVLRRRILAPSLGSRGLSCKLEPTSEPGTPPHRPAGPCRHVLGLPWHLTGPWPILRYPLIIDPSGQATEFIMNEYKDRKITRTSFLDDAFRKNLESALRFGNPLLVQVCAPAARGKAFGPGQ